MSKLVDEAILNLKTSEPVFQLQASNDYSGMSNIIGKLVNKVKNEANSDNVFSIIAVENFAEYWDRLDKKYKVHYTHIDGAICSFVQKSITMFLHNEFATNDMIKWYTKYAMKSGWNTYGNKLRSIFAYLVHNRVFEFRDIPRDENSTVHAKNAINLLKLIYDKDFQEDHVKKRRRKKR